MPAFRHKTIYIRPTNYQLWLIVLFFLQVACKKTKTDTPVSPPPVIPILLTGSDYHLGNVEKNIKDTFTLQFNKGIQVRHILNKSLCLPDLHFVMEDNNKTIKFTNSVCYGLGSEYVFEFSVADNNGQVLTDSISFHGYVQKKNFPGIIRDFFIMPDNTSCWITTSDPNRLILYDINQGMVTKTYDLSFTPSTTKWNPYNNNFYVLQSLSDIVDPLKIYVINPGSGTIEKTIPILRDQYDPPPSSSVRVNPADLAFASNGYGILIQGGAGSGRWKIIDSRLNDTLYVHPEWLSQENGTGNDRFRSFLDPQSNFDNTKILMLETYDIPQLAILDCISHSLTEYVPPGASMDYRNYVVQNKKNSSIYFGNIRNQYIMSGSSSQSQISSFDNRFDPSGDFSYRPNETNHVYFMNMYTLSLLDYNNAITKMSCLFLPGLKKIKTTTDGKYLLAASYTSLLVFDTNIFYRYL
jgi:hypothetical protein